MYHRTGSGDERNPVIRADLESFPMLTLIAAVRVCVVDAQSGKPVSNAYVRGRRDWNLTDGSGCTELKHREDSIIVVRVGYRSVKVAFSDTVRLSPSPVRLKRVEVVAVKTSAVEHLPFSVSSEGGEEVSGALGPDFSDPEISSQAYGTPYSKPVLRGFSAKRLTLVRDGFVVRDLSSGYDHPLHIYGNDVGEVVTVKGSAGAVFGGGFGGLIYVKSREARFSDLSHRVFLSFTPNGHRTRGGYSLNWGGRRLALMVGGEGTLSGDYYSGSGEVPNSFHRGALLFSQAKARLGRFSPTLGMRYDTRTWGVPMERAVSHSIYRESYLTVGGWGIDYQSTLQMEMCGRDTATRIGKEVLQGKYEASFKDYHLITRLLYERMSGGELAGGDRTEAYASLYGPLFVRTHLQIMGGIGGKVVGRKGDLSALLGLSLSRGWAAFGVSLSRSFRFPTLYETNFVGVHHGVGRYDVGNPNLRREVSHEVQTTLRMTRGPLGLTLEAFANYVRDFITVVPTGEEYVDDEGHRIGVYRWINTDALFLGGKGSLYFVRPGILLSLSYTGISSRLLNYGDEAPYMPLPEFRLMGRISKGAAFLRAKVRYVPSVGKVLGDVEAGFKYGAHTLSLGVFNPLNEMYHDPTDPLKTPLPGRSLYLNVRAHL